MTDERGILVKETTSVQRPPFNRLHLPIFKSSVIACMEKILFYATGEILIVMRW